jgi:hypothetical protein
MAVSDIDATPVTDPAELEYLSGLSQFYRIENRLLFKIVRVATGVVVRERFVAIRIIVSRRIPIPVPKPLSSKL